MFVSIDNGDLPSVIFGEEAEAHDFINRQCPGKLTDVREGTIKIVLYDFMLQIKAVSPERI